MSLEYLEKFWRLLLKYLLVGKTIVKPIRFADELANL